MNDEVIGFVNIKDDPLYQKGMDSVLAEIKKLRKVCAEAYQLAGAFGASEEALDNLSAAANGDPLPYETFLPIFVPDNLLLEMLEQLSASQAREQQLRDKVSELINATPGHAGQCSGLKCREPYCYSCNDEDEADKYLQQIWDLCHSARELLKQSDTSTLESLIAKAGEVMRERCAVECETHYNFSNALAAAIRVLPAVTLDEVKG